MKPRIYTDTSVLGGCEDEEFREPSRRLLDAFQRGELTLVLSELTVRELEAAPEAVRTVLGRVPSAHIVNLKRIHAYNSVNLKRGYPLLEIRTPREVPGDE